MDNIVRQKVASLERCLKRIEEDYIPEFKVDFTHQDAVVLNLQRACQLSIDLAAHIIRVKKLGVPKTFSDGFDLLLEAQIIESELCDSLQSMVGFRNIAVHEYQELNLDIVEGIISDHLVDFLKFSKVALQLEPPPR